MRLYFGRLLHRQVGRPVALENTAGIDAGQSVCVGNLRSVTHQASGCSEPVKLVDCGHRVLEASGGQIFGLAEEERTSTDHHSARPQFNGLCESRFDVARNVGIQYMELDP